MYIYIYIYILYIVQYNHLSFPTSPALTSIASIVKIGTAKRHGTHDICSIYIFRRMKRKSC